MICITVIYFASRCRRATHTVGLFVPKPSTDADYQRRSTPGLGEAVRVGWAAGGLTGHAAVTGPVRRWFPAIASPCVKTQGGQAERQDRSTEASTTQARSARTRSTQTGGSPGRGTAARRAALAPRRPGSWKASRELPLSTQNRSKCPG